jgi:lipoprotein-anchoring transpeptidase ErfK/SrfK
MKNVFSCPIKILVPVFIVALGLGLISCRQVVSPPRVVVSPPVIPAGEAPQSRSASAKSIASEEERADRTEVILDIPPPIPVLPPIEAKHLPLPEEVKIVVKKNERKLLLYQQGELLKMYPVDLGRNPLGPKVFQGDLRTPEGDYSVVERRDVGQTKFYLALVLNYPNGTDRLRYDWAVKSGFLPKDIGIGGLIEIHGDGIGFDWTEGCIALDNPHMQELFRKIPLGTSVRIEP